MFFIRGPIGIDRRFGPDHTPMARRRKSGTKGFGPGAKALVGVSNSSYLVMISGPISVFGTAVDNHGM